MEPEKLKQIIEAALLAADEPLTVDQLVKLFKPEEIDKETIRADLRDALNALTEEADGRGYELMKVASGYRYQVRQELSVWVSRLWEEKPPRYTRALLETLSLVAYKQPVTRGDIEQVRGVSVGQNIMRTLLERNWIRVVGQREVPGRPSMYGTTREFLDYFNLKSLDQLPPLAEIRELIEPVIVEELESGPDADRAAAEHTDTEADAADSGGDSEARDGPIEAEADATPEATDGDSLSAEVAASLDDDEEVDLDSDAFEAEIAAALEEADQASARFNNPEPDETEVSEAEVSEIEGAAEESPAESDAEPEAIIAAAEIEEAEADADAEPKGAENPERAQVVDVVTGLDSEAPGDQLYSQQEAQQEAEQEAERTQPTADVVQLPRAPH